MVSVAVCNLDLSNNKRFEDEGFETSSIKREKQVLGMVVKKFCWLTLPYTNAA